MRNLISRGFRSLISNGRDLALPLAILFSGFVFQNLAAFNPWLIEGFYSRTIYPRVVSGISLISGRVNYSIGEIVIVITLLIIVVGSFVFCVGMARRRNARRGWVLKWLGSGAWIAAGFLWLFLLTFGLNYQRPLLFELLGFERRKAEPLELEALGRSAVESVNRTYLEAHEEGRTPPDGEALVRLLEDSYDSVSELGLLPRGDFAPPKPVKASEVLTRLGISGIYFPFTAEPNYNPDIPDFQIPFSIAHEMAHQRGIARESEANFVAYVVCVNSRHPFVRYAGYRNGLGVLTELYRVEPEKAKELGRLLGAGYREDSRRAAAFWAKASGTAGTLSHRVNDLYLRANRVKAGVADYSNSTTLIIAYHLREKTAGSMDSPR